MQRKKKLSEQRKRRECFGAIREKKGKNELKTNHVRAPNVQPDNTDVSDETIPFICASFFMAYNHQLCHAIQNPII